MKMFRFYRGNLPHLRAAGATYFLTWRLEKFVPFLSPNERTIVVDILKYFHGTRYDLLSYVVMDDHVHLLVHPREGWELEGLVRSWKSISARQINLARCRTGPLWMSEYMDRMIRDELELNTKIAYIRSNPSKRWPELESYLWVEEFQHI